MKFALSVATALAAAATFSLAVSAQTTGQPSGASQPASSAMSQQDQQVTLTGCVQREEDYRRAHDKGRGGVAGTGAGVGNEFVLTNVSPSPAGTSGSATGTSGSSAGYPSSSSSSSATAYELTGPNEGQVAQYVGKRVEISGKVKAGETGATGTTGGPTAGAPPSGIDVASKDLKLREFEVTSVRESSSPGSCPSSSQQ
ncbi:MAG TPA: hypothetical protein VK886_03995 [Vicinamibacterales bacterium]|nr:hypothetical protein [Vicinamibacterales bacterium]